MPFRLRSGTKRYRTGMMNKVSIAALLLALSVGTVPASAQVSEPTPPPATNPDTDSTDQSEEDWRRSKRKRGTRDIYETPNTTTSGGRPSVDYRPITAVERLPEESRRHVMRERAKAIAQSDDGDLTDADFTPSDAAQSDEALLRQEQAAWAEVTAPAQPGGPAGQGQSQGQGQDQSQGQSQGQAQQPGQPGQGGQGGASGQSDSSNQTGPRGGSARSLQDIMNGIKSGQVGGSGQQGDTQSDRMAEAGNPSGSQAGSPNGSPDGSDAGAQGDAQSQGQAGASGDRSSDGQGQSGGGSGADGQSGAQSSAQSGTEGGRAGEALSPLELIRRSRDDRPAQGVTRSASDYLGQKDDG